MKKQLLLGAVLVFALSLAVPSAYAQFSVGPRLGYDIEAEAAFLGAEGRFGLPVGSLPLQLQVGADYFFLSDGGYFGVTDEVDVSSRLISLDVNVLYPFGVDNQSFTPYAGVGLAVVNSSYEVSAGPLSVDEGNTDLGINLVGGAVFGTGALRPFAQARLKLGGDANLTSIMGGILFRFGGQ